MLHKRYDDFFEWPAGAEIAQLEPQHDLRLIDSREQPDLLIARSASYASKFRGFLEMGAVGLVWVHGDELAAYAWMFPLSSERARELVPPQLRQSSGWWISHCRTMEEFRGRGLYKSSLCRLLGVAEMTGLSPVLIDVARDNVPSNRAVDSLGFRFIGTLELITVEVGKRSRRLHATWKPDAERGPSSADRAHR